MYVQPPAACANATCCAEWDWREETASWEGCPATEDAVRADHAAAMDWYQQAKQRGEDVPPVSLGVPPSASSELLHILP